MKVVVGMVAVRAAGMEMQGLRPDSSPLASSRHRVGALMVLQAVAAAAKEFDAQGCVDYCGELATGVPLLFRCCCCCFCYCRRKVTAAMVEVVEVWKAATASAATVSAATVPTATAQAFGLRVAR